MQICGFCTENHDTKDFTKMKILQNYNLEASAEMENMYFMGARRPWQPRPPSMYQNPNAANYNMPVQNSWNVPMPWKNWLNQQQQTFPQQGWRGYYFPQQFAQQQSQPYQKKIAQPYSQHYQSQYSQPYPQQYPPQPVPYQQQNPQQAVPAPPQITSPQLQLPSNQPPRPTQLPAQPIANPKNRIDRPTYSVDEGPSYPTLPLQYIELRSGWTLHKEPSPTQTQLQQEKQKEDEENQQRSKQIEPIQNDLEQNQQIKTFQPPPFPEILHQPRPPTPLPKFDVLDELRNVYIKIPLLQAIKDISIYTKEIKELCLKKPAKKRFDPKTIHVIGNLAGLRSNIISMEKYVDPGIPRVTTIINKISIPNTMIDLGVAINVMTLDTMKTLQLTKLQTTPIVLELTDRCKVIPKGV